MTRSIVTFFALHSSKMSWSFESMAAFSKITSSLLVAVSAGIVGPGKNDGLLTFSPQDLKPAVKALQCCSKFPIAAAAPTLRIVQSEKVADLETFFSLIFQDPRTVEAVLFPEYMTFGAASTRPGTPIILGSTVTPKAFYEGLSVLRSLMTLRVKDRRTYQTITLRW